MFTKQYNGNDIRKAIFLYSKLRSFRKEAQQLEIGKSSIHRWYSRFSKFIHENKADHLIKYLQLPVSEFPEGPENKCPKVILKPL